MPYLTLRFVVADTSQQKIIRSPKRKRMFEFDDDKINSLAGDTTYFLRTFKQFTRGIPPFSSGIPNFLAVFSSVVLRIFASSNSLAS